ncbi:ERF family protein [Jiella pelagia]|uniref:ERF family protein n=1 Tax=Jiella pelagia TaxID=2986949 RepID=A0ABY7C075_9HYPH|nr:ERF family protein [Jiella pelagia]WAP69062.1 ERF family protein [Jiella pelagia]
MIPLTTNKWRPRKNNTKGGADVEQVITALNAAYTECGYVRKEGKMDAPGAKYTYAKEADFISAVRPALINHGLTITPSEIGELHHSQYSNKSGTPTNRVVGVFGFRISHISGQSITVSALGEGVDTGDKASYKAMTGALKYALRQSLLIETGDEPEKEHPEGKATEQDALTWIASCSDQLMLDQTADDIKAAGLGSQRVRDAWAKRKAEVAA